MIPNVRALALAVLAPLMAQAEDAVMFSAFDGSNWALYSVVPGETPVLQLAGETRGADVRAGRIIFADPAGRVHLQQIGAGAATVVPGLPLPCAQPTLSPDGASAVVACFRFANRQDDGAFFHIDLEDLSVSPLYDGPGLQKSPIYSPDGSQIAFVSGFRLSAERVIEHIWVMAADGSGARPIADGSDENIDPTWINDSTLVYSSDAESQAVRLWQHDLQEDTARPITNGPADMEGAAHPDGKVAYIGQTVDGFSLFLTDPANPTLPKRIAVTETDGLIAAHDPVWTKELVADE
ncbi:hypothetical protein [uncultured Roseobacter sp.]|uniref:TolB family protein n=1 Tax=uncultured Roseobacter sp. TaxID=114847 RepID=UPI0026241FCB|nr:hypothetical protein [uncultured Roseobacter sp.]